MSREDRHRNPCVKSPEELDTSMRFLINHLRVHPIHSGEIMYKFTPFRRHMWQHLRSLLRSYEVRECPLNNTQKLGVRSRKTHQLIVIHHIRPSRTPTIRADSQCISQPCVPFCDLTVIGAFGRSSCL